jgi:hypothetical protein
VERTGMCFVLLLTRWLVSICLLSQRPARLQVHGPQASCSVLDMVYLALLALSPGLVSDVYYYTPSAMHIVQHSCGAGAGACCVQSLCSWASCLWSWDNTLSCRAYLAALFQGKPMRQLPVLHTLEA